MIEFEIKSLIDFDHFIDFKSCLKCRDTNFHQSKMVLFLFSHLLKRTNFQACYL